MRCKLTKCNAQNLMAREFCVAPLPARVRAASAQGAWACACAWVPCESDQLTS